MITQQDVIYTLHEAGQAARLASEHLKLASAEIQELREKVAHYERLERSRELSMRMPPESRGDDVDTFAKKLAASNQNLDILEQALALRAEDPKLASVVEDVDLASRQQSSSDFLGSSMQVERMNAMLLGGGY